MILFYPLHLNLSGSDCVCVCVCVCVGVCVCNGSLLLCAFSLVTESRDFSPVVVLRILTAAASLMEPRLQYLWHVGSVVAAPRLWSTGSVVVVPRFSGSMACGIFLDQGSNPCVLHWKAGFLATGPPRKFWLRILTNRMYRKVFYVVSKIRS